jgi:hypothetical protein
MPIRRFIETPIRKINPDNYSRCRRCGHQKEMHLFALGQGVDAPHPCNLRAECGCTDFEEKPKAVILSPLETGSEPIAKQLVDILNEFKVTPILYGQIKPESDPLSIASKIDKADFVIADVSGASPNVMFEVGYAQGRGKPIVFIVRPDEGSKIPTNLSGQMLYVYDPSNPDRLRSSIIGKIKLVLGENREQG